MPEAESSIPVLESKETVREVSPESMFVNSVPHVTIYHDIISKEQYYLSFRKELIRITTNLMTFDVGFHSCFDMGRFEYIPDNQSGQYLQHIYKVLAKNTEIAFRTRFRPHITVAVVTDVILKQECLRRLKEERTMNFHVNSIAIRIREGRYDKFVVKDVLMFGGPQWKPDGIQQKLF